MNTDSIFSIGKTHTICEDYACHGSLTCSDREYCYAIVSDGCSSSPFTDIGSRILSICATNALHKMNGFNALEDFPPDHFGRLVIWDAQKIINELKLPAETLDATLLIALTDGNHVRIISYGDGACAIINNDKSKRIYEFSYPSGAPFYLSYNLDKGRFKQFQEEYGTKCIVNVNKEPYEARYTSDFILKIMDDDVYCTGSYKEIDTGYIELSFPISNFKSIFIMSDGIQSCGKEIIIDNNKHNEALTVKTVLDILLDVKGYQGEFMKRRFNGFLRYCKKEYWYHDDDLSISAIHLG